MNIIPFKFLEEVVVRSPMYTYKAQVSMEDIYALLHDDFFLEAIYVASPLLYDECIKLKEGTVKTEKERQKIVHSLYRYNTRMTTRSTPFGLFSTCGIAKWKSAETSGEYPENAFFRHTRLDMQLLFTWTTALLQLPEIQQYLKYYPNNSLYRVGAEVRYIQYSYKDGARKYKISGVTQNSYISKILEVCKKGMTQEEMVNAIVQEGIDHGQAEKFIENIIQSQLLVSEFEVALTSTDDFTSQIQKHLENLVARSGNELVKNHFDTFSGIVEDIGKLDRNKTNSIAQYKEIIKKLQQFVPEIDESKTFHIDAFRAGETLGLNERLKDDLSGLLLYLKNLNAGMLDGNEKMDAFKNQFVQRYESQSVLLTDVLDADIGIGYPVHKNSDTAFLVDDIPFHMDVRETSIQFNAREKWLLAVLRDYKNKDAYSIDLEKQREPVYNQEETFQGLPSSISAMFRLIGSEQETILFEGFFGPSGASVLGRFAHGSPEVHQVVQKIVAEEEKLIENGVLAEIVHMPDNRITNVIKHPPFRNFEIPFLAKPSAEKENIIDLSDLFIRMENGELILFSKRLNKRIVPCKTHMHNHVYKTLPLYHFLCDLQGQGVDRSINFAWGNLMQLYNFLPRVCYKNIIVSPAMWYLHQSALEHLKNEQKGEGLLKAIEELQKLFHLPRYVLHSEGDNELLVDLSDVTSAQIWVELIKNKQSVLLKEFLWADKRNNGAYLHQYIATLFNEEKRHFQTPLPVLTDNEAGEEVSVKRSFPIGSEWLYVKLYCGTGSVDIVLAKIVLPFLKDVTQKDLLQKCFYIKYRDPDFHIRLRILLKDASDTLRVMEMLNQSIAQSHDKSLIWKMQPDTYVREIERYGTSTIELCESVFYIDSMVTLELLPVFHGDKNEVLKTMWALRLTEEILNACKFDLEEKRSFADMARQSFQREFKADKRTMDSVNFKYNTYKDVIKDVMADNIAVKYPKIAYLLEQKALAINPLLEEIMNHVHNKKLEVGSFSLLSSLIHMMLNRIITQKERLHELLIYEFLHKYYTMQFHMNKKQLV